MIAQCTETSGGLGLAIALAVSRWIPVFNLRREEHLERLVDFSTTDRPVVDNFLATPSCTASVGPLYWNGH